MIGFEVAITALLVAITVSDVVVYLNHRKQIDRMQSRLDAHANALAVIANAVLNGITKDEDEAEARAVMN